MQHQHTRAVTLFIGGVCTHFDPGQMPQWVKEEGINKETIDEESQKYIYPKRRQTEIMKGIIW